MSKQRINPRLAKLNRSYTVEEVARLFDVHRNTVRAWIKQGLPVIDSRRPIVILGPELRAFLEARRKRNKRTCRPGEIYCVRCREPRRPAGDMVDYEPATATLGTLVGICPICEALMYRRVSVAGLAAVCADLHVTDTQDRRRISERPLPIVNSDLERGEES